MSPAGPGPDLEQALEKDKEKFQNMSLDGEWTLPAIIEGVLVSLLAIAALVWVVSLWWVGDAIPGGVWMGGGMLAAIVLGGPAGLVYGLRRGGVEMIEQLIREFGE